eukprot:tig00000331_g24162.t1
MSLGEGGSLRGSVRDPGQACTTVPQCHVVESASRSVSRVSSAGQPDYQARRRSSAPIGSGTITRRAGRT